MALADKILLYKHDYSKPNVLELLTHVEQLTDGAVVEIVFKGDNKFTVGIQLYMCIVYILLNLVTYYCIFVYFKEYLTIN